MTQDELDRIRGQKERQRDEASARLKRQRSSAAAMASQLRRVVEALEKEHEAKIAPEEPGVSAGRLALASDEPMASFFETCFYPDLAEVVEALNALSSTKQEIAELDACLAKLRGGN